MDYFSVRTRPRNGLFQRGHLNPSTPSKLKCNLWKRPLNLHMRKERLTGVQLFVPVFQSLLFVHPMVENDGSCEDNYCRPKKTKGFNQ